MKSPTTLVVATAVFFSATKKLEITRRIVFTLVKLKELNICLKWRKFNPEARRIPAPTDNPDVKKSLKTRKRCTITQDHAVKGLQNTLNATQTGVRRSIITRMII